MSGKHAWEPRIDWMIGDDGHAIPRWYTPEQIAENKRQAQEARWGILSAEAEERAAERERRELMLAQAARDIRRLMTLVGMALLMFSIALVVVPDPTARAGIAVAQLITVGTWTWCWNRANRLHDDM